MSTELLYTSAPQGLRHGSRGFCTVITTAGMPINVIGKLESISSYRHLFPPDSPRAAENPVAWSHLRAGISGQPTSILSRVAAYGTDYSGRTNKIAHHLILDSGELAEAGPTWLLRQRNLFRAEWLGQCETPSSGPPIPRGDQPSRICTTWKTVSGDAGWGGVVAEAILASRSDPLWIIYALPQRDLLLEMMDEAVSLLPSSQRWRATFSTFAANIPPDVDCRIRFVPAGTQEARFASGSPHVIDLTKQQSITAASNWVERARGVIRGDSPVVSSGSGFSAVKQQVESPPVHSSWSSLGETTDEPPPPPGPPSLPPEIENADSLRRRRTIMLGISGGVVALGSTWAGARYLAGLPILSLAGPEAPVVPKPQAPPPKPAPEPQAPRVETPLAPLDLILRYDRKQLLAWTLQEPTSDGPGPNAVQLRGAARVRFTSPDAPGDDESPDDPNSGLEATETVDIPATLISWGSESQALLAEQDLRVATTRLSDGAQTVRVQKLPYAPSILGKTSVYWSEETEDLIANSEVDFATPLDTIATQATAYRQFAVALSELAQSTASIYRSCEKLPEPLLSNAESFRSRIGDDEEKLIRTLIRSETAVDVLTERATELSQTLRDKSAELSTPLDQSQQTALLNIVTHCERVRQAAEDSKRELAILRAGETISVPDLIFLGEGEVTLRRLPLRFHFSW